MKGLRVAPALVAAAWLTSACTLLALKDETREFEASTVLVGRVETGGQADGPLVVGAWAQRDARRTIVHQTRLHEHGGWELIVPGDAAYTVFAFADRNGNGLFDEGEPAATHPREVFARGPLVAGVDLVLGDGTAALPRQTPPPPGSTQAGAPLRLDAPAQSAHEGALGYWQPMSFFRRHGGNVLFLEAYDPARVPVLFVHGAAGSAQDWRHQIEHLDRRRYQAWVFVYPSGAPVASMANLLFWKLMNLQLRHGFERLDIVAHSMGGLVVRRCLLDNAASLPQVRRFVSLSTPWAGEPAVDSGLRWSPAVVPSWRDLQPDGDFMRALFERPLPPAVEYSLLFGHRGAPGLWRPNNDGTVTLASQLRQAAQREARLVLGFDEDHTSILSSPQVTRQLQALLDTEPGAGGRLDVRLQVAGAAPRGLPVLLLRPLDRAGAPFSVVLSAAGGGGRVGTLPPGRYEIGVLAEGFRAEPRSATVEIAARGSVPVAFRLEPQGTLSGFVGDEVAPPAGALPAVRRDSLPSRVQLRGAGVERSLTPWPDSRSAEAYAELLAGRDAAWGGSFLFFDLPAGDYELVVEIPGRGTLRSRHHVTPGVPTLVAPIR